jgi:hypothetical protein
VSNPNVLLGYISEPPRNYVADPDFFQRTNDAAIKALPTDDSYPPLCQSLFAITGDDSHHGAFREQRLIFFAGHFNYFHKDLPRWLDKFEALLRTVFWISAEVHVEGGVAGPALALKYRIAQGTGAKYHVHPPRLPMDWTLRAYRLNTWERPREDLTEYVGEGRVLSPRDVTLRYAYRRAGQSKVSPRRARRRSGTARPAWRDGLILPVES